MIKFASYNIHKGIGTDRRRDPDRIIAVLNELDADIIALQEADRRFGSRQAVIAPWLLAQRSDYIAVPLVVQTDSMGWHGNTLLVRKDAGILFHDIVHLPCLEPRGAVLARISLAGTTLSVIGAHLDLSGLWRGKQAAALVDIAEQLSSEGPVVLMGDLNEWSIAGGCMRIFAKSFTAANCGKSFHVRRPVRALDRILFTPDLRLIESGVHMTPLSRKASDHFPVWAEMEPV